MLALLQWGRITGTERGEEFFLISYGNDWSAGFMTTLGIACEMNVSIEESATDPEQAIENLKAAVTKR